MASRGVNKVILIGNLGSDPEIRYMGNGGAVANVTIATSETWRDKATGEQREKTEWHRVVIFGKLAEVAGEYLRKGSQIYIEGQLQTRKWQDQNGVERYTTEVVVQGYQGILQMLGNRTQANQANQANQATPVAQGQGGQNGQHPQAQPQQNGYAQGQPNHNAHPQANPMPQYNEPPMDFDDDIPF